METSTKRAALLFIGLFLLAWLINSCATQKTTNSWKSAYQYKPADWETPSEDWMKVEDWQTFLLCSADEGDMGTDSCYYAVFGIWPE